MHGAQGDWPLKNALWIFFVGGIYVSHSFNVRVTISHPIPETAEIIGVSVVFFDLLASDERTNSASTEEMALLSKHAGIGLWDAVLHNGDPMHAQSRWRWSDEFRRLVGFAHGDTDGFPDVVGSWADRLHPEDAQATFDAFGACLADRSGRTGYDVLYRLRMKTGAYRWFRAVGGVARDATGLASRACGALIDVHAERNEAERSDLLDRYAGVGLWDAQLHDGDPMHARSQWRWSPEFRRLLGFDSEEAFPNRVQSWSDRLHPEDSQPTFQAFGACLADATGHTGYDVVYRLEMRDGGYRWFRAVGGVARDANGRPLRACGSLLDVHDQKLAELSRETAETERRKTIAGLAETLSKKVADAAERALGNGQTVASAAEVLSAAITEISGRAADAANATARASDEADRTTNAVQALSLAADRIEVVIKLINAIATKTNLLALNATIEAARAGEAGRGFAVVANEVKSLAKQTGDATDEIANQISSVQKEARQAVDAIGGIAAIIGEVQEISATIASSMAQQDTATAEISSSVSKVVADIEQVSHSVGTVTADLTASERAD